MNGEEQLKMGEYRHKTYRGMTEEERLRFNAYQRERRANMTVEEKIKVNEYKRKWWANISEEKRLKRAEYHRKWRANMTEEEQLKQKEYIRNWRANIGEKERLTLARIKRERRPKLTEEQRIRKAEYQRKRIANMTEEQRNKLKEDQRRRHASMTEEKRMKLNEKQRNRRANKDGNELEIQPSFQAISTQEQLIMNSGYNPLTILIKNMISSNMNVDIIPGLPASLFERILKMVGIDFTCKKRALGYKTAIQNLTYKIDICYLVELLRRWEGWPVFDGSNHFSYDALYLYVKNNVINFKFQQRIFLQKELSDLFDPENFISVSCSFKQLQALFYHIPQNKGFYTEKYYVPSLCHQLKELLPEYIITCPFVSTRITLPNFSMTHQNNHTDEFALINLTDELNVNRNKSLFVKRKSDVIYSKSYLKHNVAMFLNRLKITLSNRFYCNLTNEKKIEIITALTMFESDLAQFPDVILLNYEYNWSLATYPYARYLGSTDDGNIYMSMSDQRALKKPILNSRLQQIRHPNTSSLLEKFNISFELISKESQYIFEELFLCNINDCITYKCTMCDESLGSSSHSQIISDHFSKYHGLEPDWECTNCNKSFTNNHLLNNNWKHDCG